MHVINIRRPLALDGDVIAGDQFIERGVVPLAGQVSAFGVGDLDQVISDRDDRRLLFLITAGAGRWARLGAEIPVSAS